MKWKRISWILRIVIDVLWVITFVWDFAEKRRMDGLLSLRAICAALALVDLMMIIRQRVKNRK